jgi:thiol-disulfide isomerase/thioredoxin
MIRAPHLVQGDWLNSDRAWTMEELIENSIVLVDFWEYSCVNCLRTLPYLNTWHERYATMGLRIVGIHTPEFAFGREKSNVERAIRRYDIQYPVLLDNNQQNWYGFTTRAWPTKYLIDAQRRLRYTSVGEGNYGATEAMIQSLLRELHGDDVELPPLMEPLRPTDVPGAVCYPSTPELYAGYAHGRLGNPGDFGLDAVRHFEPMAERETGKLYFEGAWFGAQEHSESADADALLRVPYRAAELNIVMASTDGTPLRVHLLHDGSPIALDEAGEDVIVDSEMGTYVMVSAPRMYSITLNPDFGAHEITLEPSRAGLRVYAFTFVAGCE